MKNQTATKFTASNIGERISITDELREWMKSSTLSSWTAEHLTAIADRIDVEHERITHNLTDALHKQEDATRELDEKSVLLPVDADGVPIHVGDVMETTAYCLSDVCFEVRSMTWDEAGWRVFDRLGDEYKPSVMRHYHEPTVEDVLQELEGELYEAIRERFASNITISEYNDKIAQTIAEYAAKLRLAGDK